MNRMLEAAMMQVAQEIGWNLGIKHSQRRREKKAAKQAKRANTLGLRAQIEAVRRGRQGGE